MSRRVAHDGPTRCGWCMDGLHVPTEKTSGCTRYRRHARPCPCPDPIHEEAPVK